MTKLSHNMISEILHARAAEGVRHFPRPTVGTLSTDIAGSTTPAATTPPAEYFVENSTLDTKPDFKTLLKGNSGSTPGQLASNTAKIIASLENCTRCTLCQGRQRVVTSSAIDKKPIVFVSDFPEVTDEAASSAELLFSNPTSVHNVLQRLLTYLSLSEIVFRTFAIRCVPQKGIPNDALGECNNHLCAEIAAVDPTFIVCCGLRSAQSVLYKLPHSFTQLPEVGEIPPVMIEGKQRRILLIPSARELEANEKWRGATAAFLKRTLPQV